MVSTGAAATAASPFDAGAVAVFAAGGAEVVSSGVLSEQAARPRQAPMARARDKYL
jgi:hypothetical protein